MAEFGKMAVCQKREWLCMLSMYRSHSLINSKWIINPQIKKKDFLLSVWIS